MFNFFVVEIYANVGIVKIRAIVHISAVCSGVWRLYYFSQSKLYGNRPFVPHPFLEHYI